MLRAGAVAVEITPGAGLAMGGYGARQGVSTGVHDPLYARVLALTDGTTSLVLAVCDLVGVPPALAGLARELIERELGVPARCVSVAATHTHSGPLMARDDDEGQAYTAVTARKIAGAAAQAMSQRQPVTLKVGSTQVSTISQNRRDPDGPIESTATVLLVAPSAPAAPVATVLSFACHATVLEYDNLQYSADFPGVAARTIEQSLGGVAIYVQGAAGDINPAWMRHDFAEIERVGGLLGSAAARVGHELRPLEEGLFAVNLSWSEDSPKLPAPGTVLRDVGLAAAQRFVDLPRRQVPEAATIEAEMEQIERHLGELGPNDRTARRSLRPRFNQLRMERAQALSQPARVGEVETVELQAFRLSQECAMLMLPGEFFVQIGEALREACGVRHLLICGYANATIGYVATEEQFKHAGYEIGRTRFDPETAALVVREAAALVRSLCS